MAHFPKKFLQRIVLGLCLAAMLGLPHCMTIHTLSNSDSRTCKLYSGTREDLRRLEQASGKKFHWRKLLIPFYAVDLPLSMIADTFALMHTIPCVFKKKRSRRKRNRKSR